MFPWYKQLQFSENPLDARPNAKMIGMEDKEEQLKNFIAKEELCFLHGLTGAGKTSLLKRVQESMPDHTFVYLDADALPKDFDLAAALRGKRTFFDMIRMRDLPTKKAVLIVDEFQATDPRLILEARSRWENPNERQIKSIVLAQISEQMKNVPGSFKDRLGNRVIHLAPLDNETMKKVLQQRLSNQSTKINYYDRLSPSAVDFLVHIADGNVRRLLEFTDMVFDFHWQRFQDTNPIAHKEDYKVTFPAAKEILRVNNINVDSYVAQVEKYVEKTAKKLGKDEKKKEDKKEIKEVKTEMKTELKQEAEEGTELVSEAVTQIPPEEPLIVAKEEKEIPAVVLPEPNRAALTFDKEFTLAEQNVLRSLGRHEAMTLKQIATDIHLEINKCNGVLANLKKKNAIISTGKSTDGEKAWQLTESAKRTMVTK
ncbi:hypothetical protein HZA99_02925 [Candidatus Woesearchaeota archaeon]|nr:hypothetical protein [Candidatus Woesearchaeota archaeon]